MASTRQAVPRIPRNTGGILTNLDRPVLLCRPPSASVSLPPALLSSHELQPQESASVESCSSVRAHALPGPPRSHVLSLPTHRNQRGLRLPRKRSGGPRHPATDKRNPWLARARCAGLCRAFFRPNSAADGEYHRGTLSLRLPKKLDLRSVLGSGGRGWRTLRAL